MDRKRGNPKIWLNRATRDTSRNICFPTLIHTAPVFTLLRWYNLAMSKLLGKAIAKARKLPREDQDLAAAYLMEYCATGPSLSQILTIEEVRDAYDQGDFATISTWRKQLGIID